MDQRHNMSNIGEQPVEHQKSVLQQDILTLPTALDPQSVSIETCDFVYLDPAPSAISLKSVHTTRTMGSALPQTTLEHMSVEYAIENYLPNLQDNERSLPPLEIPKSANWTAYSSSNPSA